MPINFNGIEIGAILTTIQKKKMIVRAVLVSHLRNQILDKDSAKDPRVCADF
jgi:hypothetical protein